MEDVLDVYQRPYDPKYPVVCFDESNKQLVKETRNPLPMKAACLETEQAGYNERYDYEYERNGTSNLFMFSEPLAGWRHVEVTDRRTKKDYAQQMKYLAEIKYPEAIKITVVQDQLNTHKPSSLYEAFEAAEAKRILDKIDFHYTPKHGSWLNMAEIEFGVLSRQCLDRRIPDKETLIQEIAAWEEQRNKDCSKIDWQFTTTDARIKLKRLYPSVIY